MNDDQNGERLSYAGAGVDLDAADQAVTLIRKRIGPASRPEVVGNLGGFAGLFALDTARYRRPLLASSTDGVGTKLVIAQLMDRHDTVGIDLVAMVVDDLVVCGAEPLFLLDYIACGRVVPERMADIVGGIAEGCRAAGCALVGGETAEHPGVMAADAYDLAATGVGIVESEDLLGSHRVRSGDVVLAMASSGLHANGYSQVRQVLLGTHPMGLDATPAELDGALLGETLLTPTRIYARDCLALMAETDVHAFAHITGGGLAANLSRVLPEHLDAVVDRGSWAPPPVFALIQGRGNVLPADMDRTFNMGVGMVAIVAAEQADRALATLMARRVPAWVVGEIVPGSGAARLVGGHPV